jgi:regulator of sigma E protease
MMDFMAGFWNYGVVFLAILTVVIFVHEFGHFIIARLNGVKVDVFSIGFGPELVGWNDRYGTRWRISALPLGGYVRMFGDADESSTKVATQTLSDDEQKFSFRHKRVGQRAAIVFAGPAANFVFSVVAMTAMFMVMGQQVIEPVVGEVMADSAAFEAGLKPGDKVVSINGHSTERFDDVKQYVMLLGLAPLDVVLDRDGTAVDVLVTPHLDHRKNLFGDIENVPMLGIRPNQEMVRIVHHTPVSAVTESLRATTNMVTSTMIGIGQMISGTRGTDELGGPIRIARAAGEAAKLGIASVISMTIFLSMNLGLINLFPVPVLDGGHLVFFGIEAVLGRPLSEKAQEYGFRIGMFLVLALMAFSTFNDVKHWIF